MLLLRVDPEHPEPDTIERAAAVLRRGGLVAFPTETVYGLGADALNPDAIARIYAAKGRPAWNPVIAHVASIDDARALAREWPEVAERAARAFWPGPLTLVVQKASHVPDAATAGLDRVGIRIPSHPVARALIAAAGRPIAAPSANRFTGVSPTRADHVVRSLGDRLDVVLDGGGANVGIESTVLDVSDGVPVILRPGMITRDMLSDALGVAVEHRHERRVGTVGPTSAQRSPGTADRHYAPHADVWLFDPAGVDEIISALRDRANDRADIGVVRALSLDTSDILSRAAGVSVHPMPHDPDDYARALYEQLHDADAGGVTLLLVERPPPSEAWTAIRDRLARAAR